MEEISMKKCTILLSAPSDMNTYIKNIKNALGCFNGDFADKYGIYFVQKNWKESTYPSFGEEAQTTINKQIVDNCDMIVALFGTRLGTPTKDHESGTIEEIIKIHNAGGNVLTYFFTGKAQVTNIDTEQLNKLRDFKATYSGLYKEFISGKDLENKLLISLKLLAKELTKKEVGKLTLASFYNKKQEKKLSFGRCDFLSSAFVIEKQANICNLIDKIKANVLPKVTVKKSEGIKDLSKNSDTAEIEVSQLLKLAKKANTLSSMSFLQGKKVAFSDNLIATITSYCEAHQIAIDQDEFFDIGEARENNTTIIYSSYSLCGTVEEKQKVEDIRDLYWKIIEFNGCLDFLKHFNNKYFLWLVLQNNGNAFCEDIDLLIKFSEDNFCNNKKLEFIEEQSAKELQDFVEGILTPKENTEIESMNFGREIEPTFIPYFNPLNGHSDPDLAYYNKCLKCQLRNIYPYKIDYKNGNVVLKIKIGDLKQFSSTFVCGALIFNLPIDKLEYVITTKSLNKQEKGTLFYKVKEIKND